MILLDSDEILAVIGRSLSSHVLPALDDEYARIQVQAALTALEEVRHRLEHGDPYVAVNAHLREQLATFAEGARTTSPEAAARVDAVRAELDRGEDPRAQYRSFAEAFTDLLADDDGALAGLRAVLEQQAMLTAATDAKWICGPAIESLQ